VVLYLHEHRGKGRIESFLKAFDKINMALGNFFLDSKKQIFWTYEDFSQVLTP